MNKLVKVCGLTDGDNIRAVEALGVDMTGFIFYPRAPRGVRAVPSYLPARAARVGVFVDASYDEIMARRAAFGLTAVQLHGSESPDLCRRLRASGLRVIKAFGISPDGSGLPSSPVTPVTPVTSSTPTSSCDQPSSSTDRGSSFDHPSTSTLSTSSCDQPSSSAGYFDSCDLFLFDTRTEAHGGSGQAFDWSILDRYTGPVPFLLSGGIGPESVEELKRIDNKYFIGIDLNSRFELKPGVKDIDLLSAFLRDFRS